MLKQILWVSLFSLISLPAYGGSFYGDALLDYGKQCAEKMGEIPEVDCIRDGTIIPTHKNGVEITTDEQARTLLADGKCDRPQLLSDNCSPFSRLIHRQVGKVHTVIQCRRTSTVPKDSTDFQDVAIIQYDEESGSTCFFQAFPHKGVVPPPYQRNRNIEGNERAKSFWSSGGSNGCTTCHSGGAYIRSPWVYGAKKPDGSSVLPWISFPKHVKRIAEEIVPPSTQRNSHGEFYGININTQAFDKKFPPSEDEKQRLQSGRLADAGTCTMCHSVGGPGYYSKFLTKFDGTGSSYSSYALSETGAKFPFSHWMPPDHDSITDSATGQTRPLKNEQEYKEYYARAYRAVKLCGEDPTMTVEMIVGGVNKKVPVCYADEETIPATTFIDLGRPVVAPRTSGPSMGPTSSSTAPIAPMSLPMGSTSAVSSARPVAPSITTPPPAQPRVQPSSALPTISPAVQLIAPVSATMTH